MNGIVIGAISLVFIGGIVALILILSSSSKASSSPTSSPTSSPSSSPSSSPNGTLPNDCNKSRVGKPGQYKLAYTSLQDKTTSKGGWAAGGNVPINCYYDKNATKMVTQSDCSNYYAVTGSSAEDSSGYGCIWASNICSVDYNQNSRMNAKISTCASVGTGTADCPNCPNDWKNSGWPDIQK